MQSSQFFTLWKQSLFICCFFFRFGQCYKQWYLDTFWLQHVSWLAISGRRVVLMSSRSGLADMAKDALLLHNQANLQDIVTTVTNYCTMWSFFNIPLINMIKINGQSLLFMMHKTLSEWILHYIYKKQSGKWDKICLDENENKVKTVIIRMKTKLMTLLMRTKWRLYW